MFVEVKFVAVNVPTFAPFVGCNGVYVSHTFPVSPVMVVLFALDTDSVIFLTSTLCEFVSTADVLVVPVNACPEPKPNNLRASRTHCEQHAQRNYCE